MDSKTIIAVVLSVVVIVASMLIQSVIFPKEPADAVPAMDTPVKDRLSSRIKKPRRRRRPYPHLPKSVQVGS